jgi:hypothetical protein
MQAVDPDGAAALRRLKRGEKNQLLTWLQEGMTPAEEARGIKVAGKAQVAYNNLMDMRAQAEGLHTEMSGVRSEKSGIIHSTDSKGRSVIRGFSEGYPFWLETTPEVARVMMGLEPNQLPPVIKQMATLGRVWRTFWTGAFNPAFAVKSIFYDIPMTMINQPGSWRQLKLKNMGGALADVFTDRDGFFKGIKQQGALPITGSRMIGDTKQTAKLIASQKNWFTKLGYYAKHPTIAVEHLDVLGGKLAHSSRMRVARSAFDKAKKMKLSDAEAYANAAFDYNNVLPNYGRTSQLLRTIDALIPYSNAGIAGTRAQTDALRRSPAGFLTKAGAYATALSAVGVYNMTDATMKEYYQDLYDTGQQQQLQNYILIALPNAHKVDAEEAAASGGKLKEGEWQGIVKIPIPPEFRAPNAVIQDAVFKKKGGEANGYSPNTGAISTLASGGVLNMSRSGGINAEMNPALNTVLELASNKSNSGLGQSYAYGDNQFLDRKDQANPDTSQLALSAANAYNKLHLGNISPAALDAQLKQLGMGGKVIRSVGSSLTKNENTTPEQLPGTDLKKSTIGVFSADGTKGMTEAKWHFKNVADVDKTLTTNTLKTQFNTLQQKKDSPGDTAAKAGLLFESIQGDGTLFNAAKALNDKDAEKSGISNPLFDLSLDQARAVLLYRSNSRMNAAKQSYAKDGTSLFQSLNLDEPWYENFKKAENDYYTKIAAKQKANGTESAPAVASTYSGTEYKPASAIIQSKLDYYYTLPKGTGTRSAFLKSNPDVVEYWNQQNALTNEERVAMGLNLLGDQSSQYSQYGYGSSGGGSGTISVKSPTPIKTASTRRAITTPGIVAVRKSGTTSGKIKITSRKTA